MPQILLRLEVRRLLPLLTTRGPPLAEKHSTITFVDAERVGLCRTGASIEKLYVLMRILEFQQTCMLQVDCAFLPSKAVGTTHIAVFS